MRRLLTGLAVALVAAVVVTALLVVRPGRSAEVTASTTTSTSPAVTTPAAGTVAPSRSPGAAVPGPTAAAPVSTPRGQRPATVSIPAIGVDAPVTELGIADDGTIEVPDVPAETGWLDTTPAPGQQGPAVVAGHVDSTTGPAVFYRLSDLVAGDEITVTAHDGTTARFTVDGVRTYAQDDFPTDEVYGPVPGPALRLITCGGDYDRSAGGYQSNVVVYAS